MKTIFKTFIFLAIFLFPFSCSEKEQDILSDFTIKFGSACGWCAGQEYITLTNSKIEYERTIPCGEDEGTTNKNRNISSEEWAEINNSFDYSLFKTLDYNECNICVDGCDEILQITENESTHELSYSNSTEVEGMEILREKLSGILDQMRNLN